MIPFHEFSGEMLTTPQLSRQLAGDGLFSFLGYDLPSASLTLSSDTAVIPVIGALSHRLAGMRSYIDIGNEIKAAANDPSIKRIVLEIDSEGGAVSGAMELADKIHAIAQDDKKPEVIAYVNGMCASAAYLIASQCNRVLSTKYSQVGSVGVAMAHKDLSGAMAKAGIVQTYIYAGEYKVEGNSTESLSQDAKARLQSKVNATYENFVTTIARGGRTTAKQLRDTKAGMFSASKATTFNLIDDVVSVEKLQSYLVDGKRSSQRAVTVSNARLGAPIKPMPSAINLDGITQTKTIETAGKKQLIAKLTELGMDSDLVSVANTTV